MFQWRKKALWKFSGKKILRYSVSYGMLAIAMLAMAFFGICTPQTHRQFTLNGKAAIVGEKKITKKEFLRNYRQTVRFQERFMGDQFDPIKFGLPKIVLERIANLYLDALIARRYGRQPSYTEMVEVAVNYFDVKNDQLDENFLENRLKQFGYTKSSFYESLKKELSAQYFQRFIQETAYIATPEISLDKKMSDSEVSVKFLELKPNDVKIILTEKEKQVFLSKQENINKINDFYKKNLNKYKQDRKIFVSQILIGYKGVQNETIAAGRRTKSSANQLSKSLYKKLINNKINFNKTVKKYSDDLSSLKKPVLVKKQDLPKEIADTVLKLKKGVISPVLSSPFGLHIVRIEKEIKAKNLLLKQVQDEIVTKLLIKQKRPNKIKNLSNEILKKLKNIHQTDEEKLLKNHKISWQKTGLWKLNSRFIPKLGSEKVFFKAIYTLSLKKPLYDQVVPSKGSYYILKLVEKKILSSQKLTHSKRQEEQVRSRNQFGKSLYKLYHDKIKNDMIEDNQYWLNPKFIDYGRQKSVSAGS